MNIVSFNMRQGGSRAALATLSERLRPDVVLLQECGGWVSGAPDDLFTAPLRWTWHAVEGNRWGSAVGLRREPDRVLSCEGFGGWVCGVEVVREGAALQIYSLHAPPVKGSYVKAVHAILDEIMRLRGEADVVIGGDFNLTVGRRLADEGRANTSAELGLLERLEEELSLVNAWAVLNSDQPLQQTLRWVGDRTAPYHCDGIFVPRGWSGDIRTADIHAEAFWIALSDHNPVTTTVEVSPWSDPP